MSSNAFHRLSSFEFLKASWGELNKANPASKGVDGISIDQFKQDLDANIESISASLRSTSFKFQPLRLVSIPKDRLNPAKGTRELRIPTIRDRVVLKALQRILKLDLEKFEAPFSHAYRRNFSVETALAQIDALSRQYPYAVEADIKSYFDEIPIESLQVAIKSIFKKHTLQPLIDAALHIEQEIPASDADATAEEAIFGYEKGIPQGSAVSPVLANFYLAPFDWTMVNAGVPMVRYADDLVLFASTVEEAKAHYVRASECLKQMGLGLHPLDAPNAKSSIRHLRREGLETLGYRLEQGRILPGTKTIARFRAEVSEITDPRTVGKGFRGASRRMREDSVLSRCHALRLKVDGKAASLRQCEDCPQLDQLELFVRSGFIKLFMACGLDISNLNDNNLTMLGLPRFKKAWESKRRPPKPPLLISDLVTRADAWTKNSARPIKRILNKTRQLSVRRT